MFTTADLPPVLFRIEPPSDINFGGSVPILCTPDGRPVLTARNHSLRYFAFLPRYISQNISGALLEFWFRLDHRLETNDIIDRMEDNRGLPVPTSNVLNMRRQRFREDMNLLAWRPVRLYATKKDVDIVGELDELQICFNTIMKVDLHTGRLWKPSFPDSRCGPLANREAEFEYYDSGLRLDHFLEDLITTVPSRRMLGIMALRRRCQDWAIELHHGNSRDNYGLLGTNDRPHWWRGGRRGGELAGRTIGDLPGNMTHEQFMNMEIGPDTMVGLRNRAATRRAAQSRGTVYANAPTTTAALPVTTPAFTMPTVLLYNNTASGYINDGPESEEEEVEEMETEDEDAEFELD